MQPIPVATRKWIATRLWLVALIGVVLMAVTMTVFIPMLFAALMPPYPARIGYIWISFAATILGSLVTALLLSVAYIQLRDMKKKGWDLVLYALVVGLVSGVISGVALFSPLTVFVNSVTAAVSGYFLFEVREYFVKPKSHKKK